MAVARVPVIIADSWIPFSFEEDEPYYLKVPENDIERLPVILAQRKGDAATLGRNARNVWERHCAPTRRAVSMIACVQRLAEQLGNGVKYKDYRDRWHSKPFLKKLGWTTSQRLALRLEQHARKWLPTISVPGVTPLIRYRNAPSIK
jgi:hypothetical protein